MPESATVSAFELRVMEHIMSPNDSLSLGAAHRILHVVDGQLTVTAETATTLDANEAWQGSMTCHLAVSAKGARVWRRELVEPSARAASPGILKLSHEVRRPPPSPALWIGEAPSTDALQWP